MVPASFMLGDSSTFPLFLISDPVGVVMRTYLFSCSLRLLLFQSGPHYITIGIKPDSARLPPNWQFCDSIHVNEREPGVMNKKHPFSGFRHQDVKLKGDSFLCCLPLLRLLPWFLSVLWHQTLPCLPYGPAAHPSQANPERQRWTHPLFKHLKRADQGHDHRPVPQVLQAGHCLPAKKHTVIKVKFRHDANFCHQS